MQNTALHTLIEEQGLPTTFMNTIEKWYRPLVDQIIEVTPERCFVLGVQGSQGSGKSTLSQCIKVLSKEYYQRRVVELSLDDFYLTRVERTQLSQSIHPLLATRGVPGTHDVALALQTINALKHASEHNPVRIPRFNKAIDDRCNDADWEYISHPVDMIILEGWCVGCTPEDTHMLEAPINELEKNEDANGDWRHFINTTLKQTYQPLFTLLDKLVVLQAPSFDCVYQWRTLQEQKLASYWKRKHPDQPAKLLSEADIHRFIAHYERLTRHCLNTLPKQADWILYLNSEHNIIEFRSNLHNNIAKPL